MKKSLKNILVALAILFSASFVTSALSPSPTYAADDSKPEPVASPATVSGNRSNGLGECLADSFLGLVPWDCGVTITEINSTDKVGEAIWTIVANIATDLTVLATYLILGYVIYGGYLYVFNSGEPSKVIAAKKTLAQAFIGFAIVMSASIIVSTVRIGLGIGKTDLQYCLDAQASTDDTNNTIFTSGCADDIDDVNALVTSSITWVVGVCGVVALAFVIYGAIMYITSAGDVGKVQKAKNIILYSLIGLIIVAIAQFITAFVSGTIREQTKMGTPVEETSMITNVNTPAIVKMLNKEGET